MNLAHRLGSDLCESWGINPHDCFRIEVTFTAYDELPYAVAYLRLNEKTIECMMKLDVVETERLEL